MDVISDYKSTLRACLSENNLNYARKLIDGFHKTNLSPDTECLYLESAYHYYSANYVFALYYADLCFMKDQTFEPAHEIIRYLTEFQGDFSDYTPTFTKDVSCYNHQLTILSFNGYLPIVDYTVNHMKKILETLGHTVNIIDIKQEASFSIESLLSKTNLIYEFNNMGLNFIDENGDDLTIKKNIPIYSYMFDSPMYFADEFINYPPNKTAILPDRNHVKYINRFYKNVKDSFFVPLGSEEKPGDEIAFADRPIGCIYLGSLKEAPAHLEDAFSKRLFEYQKKHTNLPTEDAIETFYKSLSTKEYRELLPEVAKKYPVKRTDDDFILRLNAHYCFADLKINSYFRKRLVEVLVESGIDVEVYGNGWDDAKLQSNPHFKYGGLISQDECLKKMRNSKFILNSMPWFKDGTHDRVYNAMLAKGLCITDKSKYLCEEFTDNNDIVFYDLNDMNKLPDIIRYYENNPTIAQKIIDSSYDQAVLKHSWANRTIDILSHFFSVIETNTVVDTCMEQYQKHLRRKGKI